MCSEILVFYFVMIERDFKFYNYDSYNSVQHTQLLCPCNPPALFICGKHSFGKCLAFVYSLNIEVHVLLLNIW